MTSLGKKIVSLVQDIYKTNGPVHLHEPFLDSADAEGVAEIVRSGMVSTVGCEVNTLANLIKKICWSRGCCMYSQWHSCFTCGPEGYRGC